MNNLKTAATPFPASIEISPQPGVGMPIQPSERSGKSLAKGIGAMNTPELMKVGVGAICLSASLLGLAVTNATNSQKAAFYVLQKESTPSILNARRIKDSLADMDAAAANELLTKIDNQQLTQQDAINSSSAIRQSPTKGAVTTDPDSIDLVLIDPNTKEFDKSEGFEYRQNRIAGWLVKVSQNITYPAEWEPIWQIQYGIQNYGELIQRARMLNAQGNKSEMLRVYRQAAALMDNTLLPAADRLAQVNQTQLDVQYANQQRSASINITLMVPAIALLLGSLVGLQIFLYARTKRMINPLLALATVLSMIYILNAAVSVRVASKSLKVASQDAFKSLDALSDLRSRSYMANASESRYLLELNSGDKTEQNQAMSHEQDFNERAKKVAEGLNLASKNITFDGEGQALQITMDAWKNYNQIDQQIRRLARSGNLAAAITLCVGTNQGQSNWAYEQFRDAQSKVTQLNRDAFDKAIVQGTRQITPLSATTPIVWLAIVGLAVGGIWPRLREYAR